MSSTARLRRSLVAATLTLGSGVATGQAPRTNVASTVARADSAYSRGDLERARALYGEALASDSTQSRAIFRLAQLAESDERALALYRRYIALEPADPWGHMAEGDVLAGMGRWEEGLQAYSNAAAIAPGERDIVIGRARIRDRAGRPSEAAAELAAWVRDHPDDGEAWDLIGRSRMRAGRPKAASVAFENAARRNVPGAAARLATAESHVAPSITPDVASAGDSDGNRISRMGGEIDFAVADGVRLGVGIRHHVIADGIDEMSGTGVVARIVAGPMPGTTLSVVAGATRFGASPGGTPWTAAQFATRLRARAAGHGPSIDVRGEYTPLSFSPMLVINQVSRSEARLTTEVPVAALRLRGTGRVALFHAPGEPANRRVGAEGALVLPLGGGRVQPSAQYRVTRFQRASASGYFAPRQAETVDVGAWLESVEDRRLSLSADLGGGVQRVSEHQPRPTRPGENPRARALPGSWTRAWRAWAQAALVIGPSRAWYLEVEAYDAPFALDGVASAGSWRYLSVASGLRWSLR